MPQNDPEARRDRPLDLGVYGRSPAPAGPGLAEVVAVLLSLMWLAAVAVVALGPGWLPAAVGGEAVLGVVAVVLPVALIWLAALSARTARALRAEAEQLRAALDSIRHAQLAQAQQGASAARVFPAADHRRTGEAAAPLQPPLPHPALREEAAAIAATFASRRDPPRPAPAPAPVAPVPAAPAAAPPAAPAAPAAPLEAGGTAEEQPALALGAPAETAAPALPAATVVRALHFPDSPDDDEGFRALRAALQDRDLARLIRSAQDVLTLLGQDGLYMDDLEPDRARPELWRRFAEGARGREIAALGGVRDRELLAVVAQRMRADTVFRDAAHHFLRQFDRSLARLAPGASDAELAAFAETRTARAFMLIGRVAGTFD